MTLPTDCLRILLLDEQADRFPVMEAALTAAGYQVVGKVTTADNIQAAVERTRPDVIIVAFGMPLQEAWLKDHLPRFDKGVFIPGGGVLDYVSGRLGKAPAWMIQGHLEWLFRVYQEPRRLFKRYLVEIPWFFWFVAQEKMKQLKSL